LASRVPCRPSHEAGPTSPALHVEILDLHRYRRSYSGKGVDHQPDESSVTQARKGSDIDRIDECRDYKDTTSDPDHTGESADDQAEHQNENGLHIFPPIKSLQTHLILSISHGEPPLYNPLMESSAERDPRVYFAAERTFLAWIRTGLALMGIGFAVARFGLFLRQLSPGLFTQAEHSTGVSVWSGVCLVALGVIVIVDAIVRHFQIVHQLSSGSWTAGRVSKSAVALALLLACLGAGMALYLLFIR